MEENTETTFNNDGYKLIVEYVTYDEIQRSKLKPDLPTKDQSFYKENKPFLGEHVNKRKKICCCHQSVTH